MFFVCFWSDSPQLARASSFKRFLDHTQRRTTVDTTLLDEWWARRRDLYPTTYNTHNRQTSMPLVGFELTISPGERPQTARPLGLSPMYCYVRLDLLVTNKGPSTFSSANNCQGQLQTPQSASVEYLTLRTVKNVKTSDTHYNIWMIILTQNDYEYRVCARDNNMQLQTDRWAVTEREWVVSQNLGPSKFHAS